MTDSYLTRTEHRLLPDPRRVLAKPFAPGEEVLVSGPSRARLLMQRILSIPESEVAPLLENVRRRFSNRHRAFDDILQRHFDLVAHHIESTDRLTRERCLLVGAYFTHEYSVEAAALGNPSIVLSPDQTELESGNHRFVLSLRAIGEGHLSSIEFRSGILHANGNLSVEPPAQYLVAGDRITPSHDKRLFTAKLAELGAANEVALSVFANLQERFTLLELEASLAAMEAASSSQAIWLETVKIIRVLATSNYVTTFPESSLLSERVIFPAGPNETHGMEDARFVRFVDDGAARYYATYTAYDGFQILPQLIETADFVSFTISTLNGAAAQNKGMALFPRRIDGKYVMLSRKDRENLHLSSSTDVHFWNDVSELYRPSAPWELLQIGNCGSPLETEAGWLVLTHGVGPMREYAIGALLLDLEDPRKIIGRLAEPLLTADAADREGYVPNVVYACGGIIHGDQLVLPYGFADTGTGFATISMPRLLAALRH